MSAPAFVGPALAAPALDIPRLHIGDWFEAAVEWIKNNLGPILDAISYIAHFLNDNLAAGLHAVPPIILAVILALLAWAAGTWKLGVGSIIGLLIIQSMNMWSSAMDTLALVIVSTVVALVIGMPTGVLAARSATVAQAVRPVLDFMQTLPVFVYLVPTVVIWGIGIVPGMAATVIFAIPPGVRLTQLGIQQVDKEMVEAGRAFGARPRDILMGIQMPLAMPTIMAGVNQVIMLALSMVVVAGMVGAGGLGSDVYQGLTTLDVPLAFEAGLAVVILAMFLDRITAGVGSRSAVARANRRTAAR
ncbi:MAG TPA: proline/glycine betaine ABC transporter permease [Segeticoccus sp.]|uniref:ABC transporter permease n=1 Tax=Segeticoccus sp. TaxID=2706531 RepID=UPI002D80C903|nr:proline/glycine betaine ABC transporter permease [Segeticoccus sp.]HET8601293.1 proline/glycine betaine ABC transporter permease [Segeticoccus sp.]